ncbi:mitochondrial inner membrane protease ATP23 isoform X2 [Arachis hypogaea]|uniref:mitochondrial inner membrane protease ATP23 isoform X2 n=1 Tax=Arachis hypogaea TaxID=3818 RepID=UPI000DEC8962|nr:mitochondrial inner membrane protease ATP23 homolog isoform X2 [Arachis hypogaea]
MAQEPSSPGGSLGVKSVDEVQAMIQKSLQLPKVKFLRQRMAEAGCAVKDNFFRAVVCQGRKGMAYFAPAHGIFVCSNHVTFQDEVNQLIIHELIHAYDDCRAVNLHWNNCAHQACSEIRAGHLSGDCHFMRELLRGHFKLRGHEPTGSKNARHRELITKRDNLNSNGYIAPNRPNYSIAGSPLT